MQIDGDAMLDAAFSDWPQAQGRQATALLNMFLVHGADPGLARLRVTELFSPPRVTALLSSLPHVS